MVSEAFEDSELLDYYEVQSDGNFDLLAQMRDLVGADARTPSRP